MPQPQCSACQHPIESQSHKFCPSCGQTIEKSGVLESKQRSRRWVTVLFADIVGFTSLSELHEPDEIGALLDRILYPLTEIILDEGGTIDKYIGDAIMALFGAHSSSHNDAGHAITAALRMQDKVTQLSHQFEKEFGCGIQLRVGINTGKVLAGPVGAPPYRHFTVIGDAVNLASRLESACEVGRVLIGANTQRFSHHEFEMESGGLISVKGKANKVAAYYPLFPKNRTLVEVVQHFQGIAIPFLGRSEELKAIVSEYKKCSRGSTNALIHVSGTDSVGKSRLIMRAIEQIYAGSTDILYFETGHASKHFSASFAPPLRALVLERFETVDQFIRNLEQTNRSVRSKQPPISTELLFRYLDDEHDELSKTLDISRDDQIQLLRAILVALNFLHQSKPLALWLRLTERVDHDLSRLIDYVNQSKILDVSLPIFMEETINPNTSETLFERESHHCNILIPLEPLDDKTVETLTHSLMQTAGGAPDWLVNWLVEASTGLPGFIIDYLEHLVSRNIIQIDPELGHWLLPSSKPESVELPDSIDVLLQSELDALNDRERRLLCSAALLDRPFSKEDFTLLIDTAKVDPVEALNTFLECKLLVKITPQGEEEGFQFRNSSLRQVAEDALTIDDRRAVHARIAEYLKSTRADPSLIAAHLIQAQSWTSALSFTLEAIHIATGSYALQRAKTFLKQADFLITEAQQIIEPDEEILAHLQMCLVKAEIAFYDGRTSDADEALEVVLKDCQRHATHQQRQSAQFRHSLLRLRAFATKLGGNIAARLNNHAQAIQYFEQALQDLCTLHRPASELCSIEASISWALLQMGQTDEAKLRSELALESMQLQLKPPPMMRDAWARHYDTLGNIAMNRNELHDAHALFLAAQALRRINGSVSLLAHSEGNIAGVLALKGEWQSSAEAFERVAAQWATLGNSEMELIGRLNLIECLLELESPPDGARRNQVNGLLEVCSNLLKPLRSPHLEGVLDGHRERALSLFALS